MFSLITSARVIILGFTALRVSAVDSASALRLPNSGEEEEEEDDEEEEEDEEDDDILVLFSVKLRNQIQFLFG